MTTGQLSQIATVVTGHESALKFEKVVDSSANVLIRVLESSRWDHRLRLDEIYLAVPFLIISGDF